MTVEHVDGRDRAVVEPADDEAIVPGGDADDRVDRDEVADYDGIGVERSEAGDDAVVLINISSTGATNA